MIKEQQPKLKEPREPLANQLSDTIQHVREVSHDLVPAVLYKLGLSTALKSISNQLDNMVGLSSVAHIDTNLPTIDKKKELAIYRIVQESVNNAIKHAYASQIDIYLNIVDGELIAKVVDNGGGIAEDKKDAAGLGLNSMKERAEAFNGSVHLHSDLKHGTSVWLRLPA